MEFLAPGYYPLSSDTVDLQAGQTTVLDITLSPMDAVSLDTVMVQGVPVPRYLQDFYERRSRRMGAAFFTEKEIKERWIGTPVDLLRRVRGIKITLDRDGSDYIISNAYVWHHCPPVVFLDGTYVGNTDGFDITMLNVENLAAVEAYTRPVQMPTEFNTTGSVCGVLVLWTKH